MKFFLNLSFVVCITANAFAVESCTIAAQELQKINASNQKDSQVERSIENAIKLCPSATEPRYSKAAMLYRRGRYKEALSSFLLIEKSRKLDIVAVAIALCHQKLGDMEESRNWFAEALSRNTSSVRAMQGLGGYYYSKKDYEEAISILRGAITREPSNIGVRYTLGLALEADGQLKKANKQYTEVLSLDPRYANAYLGLVRTGISSAAIEQGLALSETILRDQPKSPKAYLLRASLLDRRGDFFGSRETLEKGLDEFKSSQHLKNSLAISYVKTDEPEKAVSLLKNVSRRGERRVKPMSKMILAWAYLRSENYEQSERLFTSVLAQNEDNSFAIDNLGVIFERTGRSEKAIEMFRASASIDPNSPISSKNLFLLEKKKKGI